MVDICSACTVYRVFFHQSPSVAKMQGEIGKTVLIVVQCCSNVVQMLFKCCSNVVQLSMQTCVSGSWANMANMEGQ